MGLLLRTLLLVFLVGSHIHAVAQTCFSNAGTMDPNLLNTCIGESITGLHYADEIRDFNDVLRFVIHDRPTQELGIVLAESTSPFFDSTALSLPAGVYYLSSVVGNNNGAGSFDPFDPCLSVSSGTQIIVSEPITSVPSPISGDIAVCNGGIGIYLVDIDPDYVGYNWILPPQAQIISGLFTNQIVVDWNNNVGTYNICVEGINDCGPSPQVCQDVVVKNPQFLTEYRKVCEDDCVFFADSFFCEDGIHQLEYLDQVGCDSTVQLLIEWTPLPDITLEVADNGIIGCNNDCVRIAVTSTHPDPVGYRWTLTDGSFVGGTTVVSACEPGTVFLEVQEVFSGCFEFQTIEITADTLVPDLSTTGGNLCETPDSVQLIAQSLDMGASLFWTTESGDTLTGSEPFIQSGGTYVATAVGLNFCESRDTQYIPEDIELTVNVGQSGCFKPEGYLAAHLDNEINPSFEWNTGAEADSIGSLLPGWYSLTVTDGACRMQENIQIEPDTNCIVRILGRIIDAGTSPDCEEDQASRGVPDIQVVLSPLDMVAISDAEGFYFFDVPPGDYSLEIATKEVNYDLFCPTNPVIDLPGLEAGELAVTNRYYLNLPQVDVAISAGSDVAIENEYQRYDIRYCNQGQDVVDGSVFFRHDPILTDFSVLIGPDANYNDNLKRAVWLYDNLQPGECRDIRVQLKVPNGVSSLTSLQSEVEVNTSASDFFTANNEFSWDRRVRTDRPDQEKLVFLGASEFGGPPNLEDTTFVYHIHFQNPGPFPAQTVIVRDYLDPSFDLSTFQFLAASHPVDVQVAPGRELVCTFTDIHLPDTATDFNASQGFVLFKITRPGSATTPEVSNTARISFDYNTDRPSNTVINTYPVVLSNAPLDFSIETESGQAIGQADIIITGNTFNYQELYTGQSVDLMVGQSYQVSVEKDVNHLNGISTFDLVVLSKHILGSELMTSPYQILAGDVNKSNSLSVADIVEIRKLILFINTSFSQVPSWGFVDANYSFPNPVNPFIGTTPSKIPYASFTDLSPTAEFIGFKYGDLNGTANPNGLLSSEQRSGQSTLWYLSANEWDAGDQVTIKVFPETVHTLQGFQLGLNFSTAQLSLQDITSPSLEAFDFTQHGATADGQIRLSYTDIDGFQPNEDQAMLELHFIAKAAGNVNDFELDTPFLSEIYLEEAGTTTRRHIVLESKKQHTDPFEISLSPNPAVDQLWINHTQPLQQITIYNSRGQQVKRINPVGGVISIRDLANGLYWLEAEGMNGEKVTSKFVKVK